MPFPLVPAIAAGVGFASQGINAWIQNRQNQKANQFNKDMADYSYSKDLEMFNKANEYNSPKMQMQRFEDAGLNKNLIYSQGQPGQAAVSMPKYQDVKGTFGNIKVDPKQAVDMWQNAKLFEQQYDLLREQIKLAQYNAVSASDQYYANQEEITKDENGMEISRKPSIWQWQYDAAKNKSLQSEKDLTKAANEAGISEQQLNWAIKKMQTMNDTQINIDKDSILYRQLAEIFAPLLKYVTPKIRKFFTP